MQLELNYTVQALAKGRSTVPEYGGCWNLLHQIVENVRGTDHACFARPMHTVLHHRAMVVSIEERIPYIHAGRRQHSNDRVLHTVDEVDLSHCEYQQRNQTNSRGVVSMRFIWRQRTRLGCLSARVGQQVTKDVRHTGQIPQELRYQPYKLEHILRRKRESNRLLRCIANTNPSES